MSHELVGKRFLAREEGGWHRIGRVFGLGEKVSAMEAIDEVAGDVDFLKVPLRVVLPNGVIVEAPKLSALVRGPIEGDDRHLFIDTVKSFHLAQYHEYGEALNVVSDHLPVETCGLLMKGTKLFISFRGQDYDVMGRDPVKEYAVAVLSQKPGVANFVMRTDVRVVCNNTVQFGESRASAKVVIPHHKDVVEHTKFATNLLGSMAQAREEARAIYEIMARTPMNAAAFAEVVAQVWPYPEKPAKSRLADQVIMNIDDDAAMRVLQAKLADQFLDAQRHTERWQVQIDRVNLVRDFSKHLLEKFNDEHSWAGDTWWAGFNALTENANWRAGRGEIQGSVLAGDRGDELARIWNKTLDVSGILN